MCDASKLAIDIVLARMACPKPWPLQTRPVPINEDQPCPLSSCRSTIAILTRRFQSGRNSLGLEENVSQFVSATTLKFSAF